MNRQNRHNRTKASTGIRKTILSTADVARLFNVTETTVKRWADDGVLGCQRTPGGHRKFDIRHVVDFAEKNNLDPSGVLAWTGDPQADRSLQVAVLSRDYGVIVDEFVRRALSTDKADLFLLLSYLYEHKMALWEIYDSVIRSGMREIGERWVRGEIGINHEHRASYETLEALAKLQAHVVIKPATGRSVICTCLGDELHEIGLRCTAYQFEAEGWRVHYLGARIPAAAVVDAIRELQPDIVCLSIKVPENVGDLAESMQRISGAARGVGGRLIAGGSGASEDFLRSRTVDAILDSTRALQDYIMSVEPTLPPVRTAPV